MDDREQMHPKKRIEWRGGQVHFNREPKRSTKKEKERNINYLLSMYIRNFRSRTLCVSELPGLYYATPLLFFFLLHPTVVTLIDKHRTIWCDWSAAYYSLSLSFSLAPYPGARRDKRLDSATHKEATRFYFLPFECSGTNWRLSSYY
jgi:hypothetical protein